MRRRLYEREGRAGLLQGADMSNLRRGKKAGVALDAQNQPFVICSGFEFP
jgi:hypothetical protein